jgi:trigger factor
MKSSLEKVSELERKLNVEVPASTVASTFDRLLKNIQKNAHIKGFRPGKAPLATIKNLYSDKVIQDVVNELIQKHYFEALKEHDIEPVNYPEFDFKAPSEATDFSFTANFEIRPDVKLKKYEGLEVEKEKYTFDDKKVDQVLENIRSARAQNVAVLEDRPAKEGDIAVVDFEGFVDGKPLDGGKGENHNLELGAKQFIEGFEEGVVGMKVGAQKTLNLKFPDPYHSADLAGKPVEFKVTLKALNKKELPELTDDFLKSIGSNETVDQLKETIRKDLEQSETKRINEDFRNRLLKALVKANPVDVPASMMKDQKASLLADMKKRMQDQGMPESEFDAYAQKWDKDFENTAAEMIQSAFVVDEIAKKHDLKWTKEDFDKKLEEYAKQTGIEMERIREFYSKPEQTQRLTYMITEDKVIEFLTKAAKIKEVEKSKLKESSN